ncbi:MAG: helix-turn-helix domain-containing protein [Bacteroidota bacterium]
MLFPTAMLIKVWPVEDSPYSPIRHFFLWQQSIPQHSIHEYMLLINRNAWMIGFQENRQISESMFIGEAALHQDRLLPESPWILGVVFRIGRYQQVVDCPMSQISEQVLSLQDHLGARAASLLEQLAGEEEWDSKIEHLYQDLLVDTGPYGELQRVLKAIEVIRLGKLKTVDALTRELGIGRRKLERLFHSFIGLSPKTYIQLERFRRVVQLMKDQPGISQAELVVLGGYYDQAHLIRQFKSFAGMTPRQFRNRNRERHLMSVKI